MVFLWLGHFFKGDLTCSSSCLLVQRTSLQVLGLFDGEVTRKDAGILGGKPGLLLFMKVFSLLLVCCRGGCCHRHRCITGWRCQSDPAGGEVQLVFLWLGHFFVRRGRLFNRLLRLKGFYCGEKGVSHKGVVRIPRS